MRRIVLYNDGERALADVGLADRAISELTSPSRGSLECELRSARLGATGRQDSATAAETLSAARGRHAPKG